MADDKSKTGSADRSRVSAEEDYEVSYLARKFATTSSHVRDVIARVGGRREDVERELDGKQRGLNP
jgi:fibrillarin-like rRNA methylase